MRLFVAAWPTDQVVADLTTSVGELVGPGLRPVPPANWHVTMVFLGSVDDGDVDAIADALGPLRSKRAVTAVLGPAITSLGRGVLCLPAEGLDDLADVAHRATEPFNRSPDRDRPFSGHLTLARSRRAVPRPLVGRPAVARWEVAEVLLVASTTATEGPRYRPVATVSLEG
ncbi:MAG: RNA 2',3'-cyclic phosphodiesterase [Acidimicrobiales bacterium]